MTRPVSGDTLPAMAAFNGLGMGLGTLSRLSTAETRSISPENLTGERGRGGMAVDGPAATCARDLGQGWKISPFRVVQPGETQVLADIEGSGAIQHIWLTPTGHWRFSILRVYWDGQEQPSVECPVGDFFACGWNRYAPVSSLAVCVNPGSAFNCYWEMPFRKRCRITLENIAAEAMRIYWQIDYTLTQVPEDAGVLPRAVPPGESPALQGGRHHPRRGEGPRPLRGHLPRVGREQQQLVGRRRDQVLPRRRPGVPDHLRHRHRGLLLRILRFRRRLRRPRRGAGGGRRYQEFTTAVHGARPGHPARRPEQRPDPVRHVPLAHHGPRPVREGIRVTIQALGWRSGGRYLPLQDDIASTAFWYQALPTAPFPRLPDKDSLEVI